MRKHTANLYSTVENITDWSQDYFLQIWCCITFLKKLFWETTQVLLSGMDLYAQDDITRSEFMAPKIFKVI